MSAPSFNTCLSLFLVMTSFASHDAHAQTFTLSCEFQDTSGPDTGKSGNETITINLDNSTYFSSLGQEWENIHSVTEDKFVLADVERDSGYYQYLSINRISGKYYFAMGNRNQKNTRSTSLGQCVKLKATVLPKRKF